jgi:hypothetical protein
MSSTTIRYREAEFVANDLPIEVWMLEVAHQIDADGDVDPWLHELREEWSLQATSGFDFGPSPALDGFVTTDDRRQQLAHYFRNALESLSERNSIITPDELSQSKVGGLQSHYARGLPTRMVIEVGNQFLGLIA